MERIDRLHNSGRLLPWTTLAPKAALPLSVYLPACVIPRLLHEPSIAGRLPPATLTALRPVPCPSWRQGVEYWEHKSDDRRTWAKAHYPGADMFAAIECSRLAAPHLDRRTIGRLAALHSHAEWVATHAPTNPPPGYVPAPRTTTAPLTLCLPSPDLPPPSTAAPPSRTASRCAGRPPDAGQVAHRLCPPSLRQEGRGGRH